MKNKWNIFFKTLAVSLMCCGVFLSVGYFYLKRNIKSPAQNEVKDIPYSYVPENAGILFDISGDEVFFYLDFAGKSISVILPDSEYEEKEEIYGYSVDFKVSSDYDIVAGIVDSVDGIVMDSGEEELTLTGVQAADIFTKSNVSEEKRLEIIKKIIDRISNCGFSRENFLYIIENSKTNLTVPDCYYWQDYIRDICKTVRVLN